MTAANENVIYPNFRPRDTSLSVNIRHEILYQDEHVALGRCTFEIAGRTIVCHAMVERDA